MPAPVVYMTPGDYLNAIVECLGGGLTDEGKVEWLMVKEPHSPAEARRGLLRPGSRTRLQQVLEGDGVYVLAEAASYVGGMIAS